eukprot:scaffold6271_cov68-Phaeocystis_antarctica.AAC.1
MPPVPCVVCVAHGGWRAPEHSRSTPARSHVEDARPDRVGGCVLGPFISFSTFVCVSGGGAPNILLFSPLTSQLHGCKLHVRCVRASMKK